MASRRAELARAGLEDAGRAEKLLAELASVDDAVRAPSAEDLAQVADPDLALLTLARIAATAAGARGLAGLSADEAAYRRLLAVVGGSAALGDHLARHPGGLAALR
ncbi:MAG: hypothetical protein LBO20_07995, partial [Bifidobacteriaceae bacterium]|nr:hypothetical protein [Bifidobacteriaceae bacterium]